MMINRLLFALALLVLASPRVGAQPATASSLEASGNKHFELAEYDAAITDFKEAFRISDAPGYLYNIAQAYRLKGDCRSASTFYKTYLRRMPDATNAAKVRERVTEMDACAGTQPAAPTPPAPTTTTPAQPVPPPVEHPEPPPTPQPEHPTGSGRTWMKYTGLASLGVGAVGLGLGLKFMLDSRSANDDLKTTCAVTCTSAQALAIQSDGKDANRNAVIAGVAGGVFVAAGVVLFVMSRSGGGETEPAAAVSFTHNSATATYAWRF